MFGLPRGSELLIILVVILLLFGARKLPALARSIGASARAFRQGARGDDDENAIDFAEEANAEEGRSSHHHKDTPNTG